MKILEWLKKFALAFWHKLAGYRDGSIIGDNAGWYTETGKHFLGDFSYAVVRANQPIEDSSQVETYHSGTYVGIYDGHGGNAASGYVCDHLFGTHLIRLLQRNGGICGDVILGAFAATEAGFMNFVMNVRQAEPRVQAMGSCCLVGIIWGGTLYVANLGDSRAVLGRLNEKNEITADQLTVDHNVNDAAIRQALRDANPQDPGITVEKAGGVHYVKGVIQVTRAIGDAFLKSEEYALGPQYGDLHFAQPIIRPALTAVPEILARQLDPNDRFLIFASDGLWDILPNEEAVEMVYRHPREGIARRLLEKALARAAKSRNMRYRQIQKLGDGGRRDYHDDITVVVLFIDQVLWNPVEAKSVKPYTDGVVESAFTRLVLAQGQEGNEAADPAVAAQGQGGNEAADQAGPSQGQGGNEASGSGSGEGEDSRDEGSVSQ